MELWLVVGVVILIVILSLVSLFKKNSLRTALITLANVLASVILVWDVLGVGSLAIHFWSWAYWPNCPNDSCDGQVKLWMALPWIVPVGLWIAASYVGKRNQG